MKESQASDEEECFKLKGQEAEGRTSFPNDAKRNGHGAGQRIRRILLGAEWISRRHMGVSPMSDKREQGFTAVYWPIVLLTQCQ
ncbi:cell wall proline rich protein [Aspergillus luchuensis]|uniref:Cell wall proline rich protein n=1 Tax=Aspergillus kawachii TaxID=1069201 RepID=A0A146FWI7_ASPKA|nr:cell wall proline rich protein [Aspergillus luchuensis]